VKSIRLALADGEVVEASPQVHSDLFFGAIGGYGAIGVIVEATLWLTDDVRVERQTAVMPLRAFPAYFKSLVRDNPAVIFHNADLYPSAFTTVRISSYIQTSKPASPHTSRCPASLANPA
jgi:FAD/FMN-containing dehydrogenase